ncbi:MAG: hypothetical protein ACP5EP_09660 [Acidobacteriaceae bacterium]
MANTEPVDNMAKPRLVGPEFPDTGKQLAGPIIEAALIPSSSGPGSPGDEQQHDEQIDFIDRKQGIEILERCFKERTPRGLKERLAWAVHDPMCPDIKIQERPLAVIHPLLLSAVIFVAAALAVFTYFNPK